MLNLALILFVVAAVLGLTVAVALFRRRPTSKPVAVAHGIAGAAGLVTLLLHALDHPDRLLTSAVVLLVVAALGGFYLFANDVRGKPGPLALAGIHAAAAVIAVLLVAVVAWA